MKLRIAPLLLVTLCLESTPALATAETPEALLTRSQELFQKEDHDGALKMLQKYMGKLMGLPKQRTRTRLRFLAIAAMGRIHLQYKRDPKGAIAWFEKIRKDQSLTDAEQDIVNGWIAAAEDWIKLGRFPEATSSEKELFEIGKRYYESGRKKQKYTMDQAGTADFSIAQTYFIPFLMNYDKSANIGEVLFMMGDMRRRLWTTNRFWSGNHYLSETIRRFPDSPLAVRAYDALKEDVEFAYSGSSGTHVPRSWNELLVVLDRMAHGKDRLDGPAPTPAPPKPVN